MRARGWSNGRVQASGAGYGVRIDIADRDRFFDRRWTSVDVEFRNDTAVVRLSPSFWRTCTELRSAAIGRWMLSEGLAPWPGGEPPALNLIPRGGRRFELTSANRIT